MLLAHWKWGAAAALAVVVIVFRKRKSRKLPPRTPGFVETCRQMQSTSSPWYLLEQARSLGPVFTILDNHAQDGSTFDVAKLMTNLTLDFILASMFGWDCGVLQALKSGAPNESEGHHILELLEITLRELNKRVFGFYRKYQIWNAEVRQARRASEEIMAIAQRLLDRYCETHSGADAEKDTSIIAHLRRTPYASQADRVADVVTLLVGGFDTTSYSLSWTLVELARHPHVVAKAQQELDRVNPERKPWSHDMLSALEYCNMVIKESMRLWPVAAQGSYRLAERDISVGDFVIPKDSELMLPFFVLFRSGIAEPDKFKPERWEDTDPDAANLRAMYYQPFSAGRRNCVGQNLAMLEMRMVLAPLIQRYTFELADPDVRGEYFLTFKPAKAVLRVRARTAA